MGIYLMKVKDRLKRDGHYVQGDGFRYAIHQYPSKIHPKDG